MNPDDMPDKSERIREILEAAGLRYENGCAVSPSGLWPPISVGALDESRLIECLLHEMQHNAFARGADYARTNMRAALGL